MPSLRHINPLKRRWVFVEIPVVRDVPERLMFLYFPWTERKKRFLLREGAVSDFTHRLTSCRVLSPNEGHSDFDRDTTRCAQTISPLVESLAPFLTYWHNAGNCRHDNPHSCTCFSPSCSHLYIILSQQSRIYYLFDVIFMQVLFTGLREWEKQCIFAAQLRKGFSFPYYSKENRTDIYGVWCNQTRTSFVRRTDRLG